VPESDGESDAWVPALLRRWQRPLIAYATRLLHGDAERARDVIQEAFCRLCREDRASVEPKLPAWLFAVVRHRAIDIRRKDRRMKPLADPPARTPAADPGPSPRCNTPSRPAS